MVSKLAIFKLKRNAAGMDWWRLLVCSTQESHESRLTLPSCEEKADSELEEPH